MKRKITVNAYWRDQILRNNTFYYVVCIAIIVLELFMTLTYFVSQSSAFPTLPAAYLHFYLSAAAAPPCLPASSISSGTGSAPLPRFS